MICPGLQKGFTGMRGRQFAGIDEFAAPRTAQRNQQQRNRRSDDSPRDLSTTRPKRWDWRTLWNRPATRTVGQRTRFACAAGPRATPAAFRFAGFRFEYRLALERCLAAAPLVRSRAARFALAGATANPFFVRTRVRPRIEFRRWKFFVHRAPPSPVARICNPLYRRIAFGGRAVSTTNLEHSTTCRLKICDTAD
jgi:hypothetical protein